MDVQGLPPWDPTPAPPDAILPQPETPEPDDLGGIEIPGQSIDNPPETTTQLPNDDILGIQAFQDLQALTNPVQLCVVTEGGRTTLNNDSGEGEGGGESPQGGDQPTGGQEGQPGGNEPGQETATDRARRLADEAARWWATHPGYAEAIQRGMGWIITHFPK